jgi:hypothetical protein
VLEPLCHELVSAQGHSVQLLWSLGTCLQMFASSVLQAPQQANPDATGALQAVADAPQLLNVPPAMVTLHPCRRLVPVSVC